MSFPDREKGEDLLAAIQAHLADEETAPRDKIGFAGSDLGVMFNSLGLAETVLWDHYYLRFVTDEPDLNMTIPPNDFLGDGVLKTAAELAEAVIRRAEDQENES